MNKGEPSKCRCCDGGPLVGYFGFCEPCDLAVQRFVALRRHNLSDEMIEKARRYRAQNV